MCKLLIKGVGSRLSGLEMTTYVVKAKATLKICLFLFGYRGGIDRQLSWFWDIETHKRHDNYKWEHMLAGMVTGCLAIHWAMRNHQPRETFEAWVE